jgi:hypothetical protein
MIGVRDIRATDQQWAKVELNPSRVIDPHGWSAEAGGVETLATLDAAISKAMSEGYFAAEGLAVTVREAADPGLGHREVRDAARGELRALVPAGPVQRPQYPAARLGQADLLGPVELLVVAADDLDQFRPVGGHPDRGGDREAGQVDLDHDAVFRLAVAERHRDGLVVTEQVAHGVGVLESIEPMQGRTPRVRARRAGRIDGRFQPSDQRVGKVRVSYSLPGRVDERLFVTTDRLSAFDRIIAAARGVPANDFFERLAIDRAVDQIAAAERRLVADMLANGQSGQQAAENWLAAHPEATRIRRSVEEIAASGLTLAKLTVAANLLGDLVKGREGTLTTSNLEHAQL